MTPKDVRQRVAAIASLVEDDERAHGDEDRLRDDVLKAIASGDTLNAAALAIEALKTNDLDFYRWCA